MCVYLRLLARYGGMERGMEREESRSEGEGAERAKIALGDVGHSMPHLYERPAIDGEGDGGGWRGYLAGAKRRMVRERGERVIAALGKV